MEQAPYALDLALDGGDLGFQDLQVSDLGGVVRLCLAQAVDAVDLHHKIDVLLGNPVVPGGLSDPGRQRGLYEIKDSAALPLNPGFGLADLRLEAAEPSVLRLEPRIQVCDVVCDELALREVARFVHAVSL